jgi:hypothetical protein
MKKGSKKLPDPLPFIRSTLNLEEIKRLVDRAIAKGKIVLPETKK